MCRGYCYHETGIDSSLTITHSKAFRNPKENPEKQDTLKTDKLKWALIVKEINVEEFNKLPERIDCPDCADGGAEWVEIGTKKGAHRVEFEYGADIEGLKGVIKILRKSK